MKISLFAKFSKSCNLASNTYVYIFSMFEYIFGIDNGVPINIRMIRFWRDYYYKVAFQTHF